MATVKVIINDMSVRSARDEWKVLLTEEGTWCYTTSKNYVVGGPVTIEERNKEFKYYAKKGSYNAV